MPAISPSKLLSLPRRERARLARKLLDSLDPGQTASVEEEWKRESRRRLDELATGKVKARPGDEVLKRLRNRKA